MSRTSNLLIVCVIIVPGLLCISGSRLFAGHSPTSATHIYWPNTGQHILRADLDGSNVTDVVFANTNVGNIAVDRLSNYVYWSSGFSISRSDLDGSNTTNLFQLPGLAFRGDMVIDRQRNQMFFADGRNNIIYRTDLGGANASVVVPASGTPSNISGISDLWLDLQNDKLYWTDSSVFRRSNLDGTQIETVFSPGTSVSDFEIDLADGKIYWAAPSSINQGSVRRANLDGSQQEVLVQGGLWGVGGVALDLEHGRMYYTDAWRAGPTDYDATIRIADLDGTNAAILINLGASSVTLPFEITIDTVAVPEPRAAVLVTLYALMHTMIRPRFLHDISAI